MLKTKAFLSDLKREYPEKLLQLLDIIYTESDLEDFISNKNIDNFIVSQFRDTMYIKKQFIESISSPSISTAQNNNPQSGEMYLDQTTGNIKVFGGSIWLDIIR